MTIRQLANPAWLCLLAVLSAGRAQELGPDEAWSSVDQAARSGLNAASAANVRYSGEHGRVVEFGGWIYKAYGGGYAYTTPTTSHHLDTIKDMHEGFLEREAGARDDDSFQPRLTSGERVVGSYHIHPSASGYDTEHFSLDDLEFAENYNIPAYLRTPSGRYRKYDPAELEPDTFDPDSDAAQVAFDPDEVPHAAHVKGEPHLGTHDGQRFDFHAAGEFVAIEADNDDFRAMVRLEPYLDLDSVSVMTATAVALGNDRIGVYATQPYLLVNGEDAGEGSTDTLQDGIRLGSGLTVSQNGDDVTIRTPAGDRIVVRNRFGEYLDTEFALADTRRGHIRGLLGDVDDDMENDFRTRGGELLDLFGGSSEDYQQKLYGTWGPSWRASDAESIFDYVHGKTAVDYQILDFPRTFRTYASLERNAAFSTATDQCRDAGVAQTEALEQCVFDIVVSGDPRFVESYRDDAAVNHAAAIADDNGVEIAGAIDAPGAVNRHPVQIVNPGQQLFFAQEAFEPALDLATLGLFPESGKAVASKCFGCGNLGLVTVDVPGTYYFQAGTRSDSVTGAYSVRYWYLREPDTYDIVPDAVIAPARPGPGAGRIERPGAADEYRFSVDAGTVLRVAVVQFDRSLDLVNWQVLGAGGQPVAQKCLGCGADEDVQFAVGGNYVLRVGTTDREPGIGTYSLSVTRVK